MKKLLLLCWCVATLFACHTQQLGEEVLYQAAERCSLHWVCQCGLAESGRISETLASVSSPAPKRYKRIASWVSFLWKEKIGRLYLSILFSSNNWKRRQWEGFQWYFSTDSSFNHPSLGDALEFWWKQKQGDGRWKECHWWSSFLDEMGYFRWL